VHQSPYVVVVSIYYRLSSFGFLATPAFRDATIGDHNAGFLDQIEAMRWVKENIASFGGDPNQVTINGESAGGSSVELHLVAKNNEGLFHRAIAQSVDRVPLPTPEQQVVSQWFFSS
jgi:carboxylesterase type B